MSSAPENEPEPIGTPWICPGCGTVTNQDACPECYRDRPFESNVHQTPGSFGSIYLGPTGFFVNSRVWNLVAVLFLGAILGPALVYAVVLVVRTFTGGD
ncbi:MAG: hypothetical protein KIS66_09380 [Fimbriimonadaceae bacterium]|nr:hypothetical protein [Fimbriimonadaceae bacterium]